MKRFALPAVLLTLAGFALACGGEEETVEPEIVLIPVPVEEEAEPVEEEVEEEEPKTIEERMDDLGDDGHRSGSLEGTSRKTVNGTGSTDGGKKTTDTTTSSGGKKTTTSSGGKKTTSSGGKKTSSGGKKKK